MPRTRTNMPSEALTSMLLEVSSLGFDFVHAQNNSDSSTRSLTFIKQATRASPELELVVRTHSTKGNYVSISSNPEEEIYAFNSSGLIPRAETGTVVKNYLTRFQPAGV